MRFRDLGPLLVDDGGVQRAAGTGRIASVLALLVAQAGSVVAPAALIDAVWGEAPPERALQSLETIIWRLRKVLEPERQAREASALLRREELGYRLAVAPDDVDSRVLERAAAEVRAGLDRGEAGSALQRAESALTLWRGQPYDGTPEAAWLLAVRARLEEVHLDLQEHRLAALIASGTPERAALEAATLLGPHPFRERLWELRMTGLYASGRQGDALEAYARARRTLLDELGVEPGAALRRLHQRILDQDPTLGSGSPTPGDGPGTRSGTAPVAEVRLPPRAGELVGRADDLAALAELVRRHPHVTVTGAGGCGKTRLAVEAAYRARSAYPDGVWFVDLASVGTPAAVPAAAAAALELAPDAGVSPTAALVGFLARRRALVVLDNCEHVLAPASELVHQLLDGCAELTVLATSREPLLLPGERTYALRPLPVAAEAAGDPSAAAELFLRRLADVRPGHPGTAGTRQLVDRICTAVGGLPLGIELAAAHARTFALADIAAALERSPGSLTRLGAGPARHDSLTDTVEWSYRLIRPDEKLLHQRLAALPGPFTYDAATALCAVEPLRPEQSLALLSGLVHRSLLVAEPTGDDRRFLQLVPVRAHAEAALRAAGQRDTTAAARDRWVLDRLATGIDDGRSGQASWFDWLDANVTAVRAALAANVTTPGADGPRLLRRLTVYWYLRDRMIEGFHWLEAARDAAFDDPYDRAVSQCLYAGALGLHQETERALDRLEPHLALAADPARSSPADTGDLLISVAIGLWTGDAWARAEQVGAMAEALGEAYGLPHVTLRAQAVAAACLVTQGDPAGAVAAADAVLAARGAENHFARFIAWVTKGIAALFAGEWADGLGFTTESLRCQELLGMRNTADTLEQRAAHYAIGGMWPEAVRCWGAAYAQHHRAGRSWPRHPGTADLVEQARAELAAAVFAQAWGVGERLAGAAGPTEL